MTHTGMLLKTIGFFFGHFQTTVGLIRDWTARKDPSRGSALPKAVSKQPSDIFEVGSSLCGSFVKELPAFRGSLIKKHPTLC